jgi:hypothetical protein
MPATKRHNSPVNNGLRLVIDFILNAPSNCEAYPGHGFIDWDHLWPRPQKLRTFSHKLRSQGAFFGFGSNDCMLVDLGIEESMIVLIQFRGH